MLQKDNNKLFILVICLMSVSTVVSFYNKKGDDMSMIKWRPFEELENFDTESQNQGFDLAVDM